MDTERRKTILYVITKSNWGGAPTYVHDLATTVPIERFDVAVAYGQPGYIAEKLAKAGVAVYAIPPLQRDVSLGADVRSFFWLLRLFRSRRPDIVHLNSPKAGGIGALAARMTGVKKIVFTAHGWPFLEQQILLIRAAMWFFSWLTALLSHHVICISDFDLCAAERMPGIRGKAVRIYNGVAQDEFLLRQERRGVHILTSTELHPNKNLFVGIDAVIRAHARDADISYDIMGDGELRRALEKHIAQRHATGFISLLGFVPEGRRHYKKYDIFFLPSKKEGVPYVLLEAGMASLPVIASNVGGIPEVIEDDVSGILKNPDDTEGFAEALTSLAKNHVLRAKFGNTLKEKVMRSFAFDRMLAATTALYQS